MQKKKIGDITLLKPLGKGTMGSVYLSQKDGKKDYLATKIIEREKADRPQVRKYFVNEIKILKSLNHNKIIRFYDLKQTNSHYYIAMEYCNGGSLLSCLKKYKAKYKKPFSEKIVQYLMKQIVSGLKYIHRHGIIHRDIKLDNILVKFYSEEDIDNINMLKTHIKICDFGISIAPGENKMAFTAIGSPASMDPFILKKLTERNDLANSEGYDQSCDIWSLGSSCYEMLIGKRVFNGRNIKDLAKKVEEGNYHLPTNLSKEVVSFINGMLQYDPKKRLNCEQLSRHQFLTRKVENFSPIDFSLIYNKVDEKGIVINTKDNKTMWQVFNSNESQIKNNNNNIMNNNNINNNENMWNIFNKETELKLSKIPMNIFDQTPFVENEGVDNGFDNNNNINNKQEQFIDMNNMNNKNNINNLNNMNNISSTNNMNNVRNSNYINNFNNQNNISNINNMNNMNNTNNMSSTNSINNMNYMNNLNKVNTYNNNNISNNHQSTTYNNNQVGPRYNSDNKLNRFNYDFSTTNTNYQMNRQYQNNNNLNRSNTNPQGNNYIGTAQENVYSSSVFPQNNNINYTTNNNMNNNFYQNNNNTNYSQLSQTQINQSKYIGDIRIKKQIAKNEESCINQ